MSAGVVNWQLLANLRQRDFKVMFVACFTPSKLPKKSNNAGDYLNFLLLCSKLCLLSLMWLFCCTSDCNHESRVKVLPCDVKLAQKWWHIKLRLYYIFMNFVATVKQLREQSSQSKSTGHSMLIKCVRDQGFNDFIFLTFSEIGPSLPICLCSLCRDRFL